ncbi:hypothetical protein EM4838_07560 [Enterococcus mundtii]|uniref:WxL domain-containing protein n=3 Tax=Enterococcus mundtii TaxID=53346 RepID=A0ABQ0VBK3_ENTMU|nr:hypothetical protein [Enterococcus mundtii]AUB52853.1 hypothetical protein EM4838_07560 [Enterococcus mundtii]GEL79862.1 hypothetical protein EMU01_10060 [Enterococcus mundtii]GEN17436.1 hypothetical protein LAC02_07170 [Ligilactobacillus acidipiscis]
MIIMNKISILLVFFYLSLLPIVHCYAGDIQFEVNDSHEAGEDIHHFEHSKNNEKEQGLSIQKEEILSDLENGTEWETFDYVMTDDVYNHGFEQIESLNGLGTEGNPYTAGTATELRDVLRAINSSPSNGVYHVVLTNHILYQDSDVFEIRRNLVVDGQGFHMLYSNSSSSTAINTGYRIQRSGVHVTLRNMNFGSNSMTDAAGRIYDNNTYYGIIGSGNVSGINFTAVFEDVDYYARTGAQPLLSWNQESTFIFKGENHFTSRAGTNSQEFMEGYNLVFGSGTKTTIDHQTETDSGFIHGFGTGGSNGGNRRIEVVIEEEAEVSILSSKQNLTHGAPLIFTIADNAKFFYRQTANRALNFSDSHATTINIGRDAQTTFLSNGPINSGNSVTFNVDEPEFIHFENVGTTNRLFARDMTLNRLDGVPGVTGDYQINYLDHDQGLGKKQIPGRATQILADNQFSLIGLRQAIYQRGVHFTWDSIPNVQIGKSELLTTIHPTSQIIKEVRYKLSTERLWSGDSVTSPAAQDAITQANPDTPGVMAVENTTSLSWQNEQLRAGTYYVYVQVIFQQMADGAVAGQEMEPLSIESLWEEKEVMIVRSPIHVEVPLKKIFEVREAGTFHQEEHSQPIITHSNFTIDFTVTHIADHSIDPTISLVVQIPEVEGDHLLLKLSTNDGQAFGPLIVGENRPEAITLEPFLKDPLELFLKGEFAGSIFKKHETDFRLTYTLTAKGDVD